MRQVSKRNEEVWIVWRVTKLPILAYAKEAKGHHTTRIFTSWDLLSLIRILHRIAWMV